MRAINQFEEPRLRGLSVWIGHAGVKLRDADGRITPAGELYERLVEERGERRRYEHTHVVHPDEPSEFADGAEYRRDIAGQRRMTRRWNPAANNGQGDHRFTPFGRLASHSVARYAVQVPVWRTFKRPDGNWEAYTQERSGEPSYAHHAERPRPASHPG